MIHIQTRRAGLLVIATTVNDHGDAHSTVAFTTYGAEQRLIRRLSREFR